MKRREPAWKRTERQAEDLPRGTKRPAKEAAASEAQETLSESEGRLRGILDASPDSIALLDLEGRVVDANAQSAVLLGYSSVEEMGASLTTALDVLDPADRKRGEAAFTRVIGGETLRGIEVRIIRRDGSGLVVEVSASPFRNKKGDPAGAVLVTRDVTALKQIHERLEESEEKHRSVFENAAEGIVVAQDGMLRMVNATTMRLTGRTEQELLSRPFITFIHPDDRDMVLQTHKARIRGSEVPPVYEFRLLHADGSIRWVEIRAVLMPWEGRQATLNFLSDVTERRETHDRAQQYLDLARVMLVALDVNGNIALLNHMGRHILGYETDITGKNWFETCLPERVRADVSGVFEKLMSGEIVPGEHYENPVLTRAGEEKIIDWHNTILKDPSGAIIGTLSSGEDITERKRAEEKLRASQRLIEGIINAIPARVFWKDKNLVYLGCNTAFAHDAGVSDPKDMIGKDDYQMGWRAQADLYRGDDRQVIESGRPKLLVEEPQTTPEGNIITLLTSKIPLRGSTGEIEGVLGTYMDITERKQAIEDLRKLKALIDHANFGVVIVDLEGDVLFVNESFAGAHGYEARELLGKSLRVFHGEEQLPRAMELISRIRETGEFCLEEVWHRHRDDHAFPMLMNGVLIRDEDGKPHFMGATAIDMTGQKDLEDKLRHSQKMEAIGTLAGGIAHDFNNILYSMLGFTELAMDQTEKESRPFRCLEQVQSAGKRAADLVNQILTFSRRSEKVLRSIRLQPLVSEAVRLIEAAHDPEIEIRTNLDAECGTVRGDPTEIHQIVMNLGSNALHAMRGKPGMLTVRLRETDIDEENAARNPNLRPGRYACLSIEDTGHGMDERMQHRIFEPFFTTKAVGEGTGLGLATVHGIVKGMNGVILVESEPGHGTRFDVLVPVLVEGPTAGLGPQGASRESSESRISFD